MKGASEEHGENMGGLCGKQHIHHVTNPGETTEVGPGSGRLGVANPGSVQDNDPVIHYYSEETVTAGVIRSITTGDRIGLSCIAHESSELWRGTWGSRGDRA